MISVLLWLQQIFETQPGAHDRNPQVVAVERHVFHRWG